MQQRDFHFGLSKTFCFLILLLNKKSGAFYSLEGFEGRISAQVKNLKTVADTTKLPKSMNLLLLLANAGAANTRHVTVLVTAGLK